MKTTKMIIVAAAVMGAAALSANAAVRVGFTVGLPVPVVETPVVVSAPAPVIVAPAPMVETVPACPGVDYVWSPGYWSGHSWIHGVWNYRPGHFFGHDGHDYDRHDGHDGRDGYRR